MQLGKSRYWPSTTYRFISALTILVFLSPIIPSAGAADEPATSPRRTLADNQEAITHSAQRIARGRLSLNPKAESQTTTSGDVSAVRSSKEIRDNSAGSIAGTLCVQPGPNCQLNDNNVALTSSGTTFRVADDFRLATGGAVSRVCFFGGYFNFDLAEDCGPVTQNNFVIKYYSDNGGIPGVVIDTFSEALGTLTIAGPRPTAAIIAGSTKEFEYVGVHKPLDLSAGTCYWIEITNNVGSSCFWLWEGAQAGDNWVMQDIGVAGYTIEDGLPDDMSFCLDQELTDVTTCRPPPPANDDCVMATSIEGVGDFLFDNRTATTDGLAHASCQESGESQITGDVWYCWTAPCTDMVLVWTCGLTETDTRLAVYEGCGTCPPSGANLLTCNDDRCGPGLGLQSFVTFDAVAGQSYMIRMGNFPGADGGSGQFHINCGTPNNTACPGEADCCAEEGALTPGCVDQTCCELICACDPFCCTDLWDVSCATTGVGNRGCGAQTLCEGACGVCGNSTVDCCVGVPTDTGTPGCSDRSCCETVCAFDPFCCEREWDFDCATDGFNPGEGAAALCPDLCAAPSCPPSVFTNVFPTNGYIDRKQPHPPGNPTMMQGISEITLTGPVNANAQLDCWSVCETSTGGQTVNGLTVLTTNSAGAYRLTLSRPITPDETTTIRYTDSNGLVTNWVIHSLPGDSNGDSLVSVADISHQLSLMVVLPDTSGVPTSPPDEDIDRSGLLGPGDVLRLIDLMNGANGYDIGLGEMIPACGVCCP